MPSGKKLSKVVAVVPLTLGPGAVSNVLDDNTTGVRDDEAALGSKVNELVVIVNTLVAEWKARGEMDKQ